MGLEREHWIPVYIGLGSNLDGPVEHVEQAFEDLDQLPGCRLVARSSLYQTSPLCSSDQPDFINAVAGLLCTAQPRDLHAGLKGIEHAHGRGGSFERWGPRPLDLDLLIFGDQILDDERLVVPHPGIADRDFVLYPLAEVAPTLNLPGLGQAAALRDACPIRTLKTE